MERVFDLIVGCKHHKQQEAEYKAETFYGKIHHRFKNFKIGMNLKIAEYIYIPHVVILFPNDIAGHNKNSFN